MASAVPLPRVDPRSARWSLLSAHPPGTALAAYVDGELSAADAPRLDRHLDACGPCRAALAGQQAVAAAVRALPERQVPETLGPALQRLLRATPR